MRRPLLLPAAVLTVLALVAVALWLSRPQPTPLAQALSTVPPDTVRFTFTDWNAVTAAASPAGIDVAGLDEQSDPSDLQAFLDEANADGMLLNSSLVNSFTAYATAYGVSLAEAEWEGYGQSETAALSVVKYKETADLDGVETRLRDLGYQAPADGPGSGGVWVGSADQVALFEPPLPVTQENVAVLLDERLLITADDPDDVAKGIAAIRGEEANLFEAPGVAGLAESAGSQTVNAVLWPRDRACSDLAMSKADDQDQLTADRLIDAAGGVSPLAGLTFAQLADLDVIVGMQFDSAEAAEKNLQPRVDLASGEAPGQGGSFAERFSITEATAQGTAVTMRLTPVDAPILEDLNNGPLLYASC